VAKEEGMTLIFLESICDDPAVIAANVALKVSMGDPDYRDMSPEDAKRDFLRRIKEYEAIYEPITEPHLSYFKIKNVGDQVTVCRIHGYLQSRIAFYLMNLHLKPRSIFFSRVGRAQVPPLPLAKVPHLPCPARREPVQCRGENWRRFGSVGTRI
jgi:6-phosphofructo-2-kinase / fructose-2,6-biphosphatase 2